MAKNDCNMAFSNTFLAEEFSKFTSVVYVVTFIEILNLTVNY